VEVRQEDRVNAIECDEALQWAQRSIAEIEHNRGALVLDQVARCR